MKANTKSFVSSKELVKSLRNKILNGRKGATFDVSLPVVYKKDKKYYLAAFICYYNAYECKNHIRRRPSSWVLLDISTGDIVKKYETNKKEFSDASYKDEYRINQPFTLDLYHSVLTYKLLDDIRKEILSSGTLNADDYRTYMTNILFTTADSIRRFYKDLSVDF